MGYQHDNAQYIAALKEQIDIKDEEIRQLREIINPPGSIPPAWGLTPNEGRMLHAIARGNGNPVNRDRIAAFVYGSQSDERCPKIFDVMLCRIRKKKTAHGIAISTVNGLGQYMSREDCAMVRDYFEVAR